MKKVNVCISKSTSSFSMQVCGLNKQLSSRIYGYGCRAQRTYLHVVSFFHRYCTFVIDRSKNFVLVRHDIIWATSVDKPFLTIVLSIVILKNIRPGDQLLLLIHFTNFNIELLYLIKLGLKFDRGSSSLYSSLKEAPFNLELIFLSLPLENPQYCLR